MPVIINAVSVAAGAVNNNLVSGSAFEFARVQSIVSMGIGASNQGAFCTIQAAKSSPRNSHITGFRAANSGVAEHASLTSAYPT